ncbi:MAG: hypothetical protein ABI649_09560 [Gaiellaceae bacterium]
MRISNQHHRREDGQAIVGQRLGPREGGGVDRRLEAPLGPVPRADVENGSGHREQDGQEERHHDDPAEARSLAADYLAKNGGASVTVSVESQLVGADTIRITGLRTAPGILARVVGIDSVQVRAVGAARSGAPEEARWAAPIAVDEKHPMLQCQPLPCFGQATEIGLKKTGPGAFRLLNLDGSRGGTSPGILAEWIAQGFDGYMPLGWYYSDPGAKFNSSQVKGALDIRLDDELLFPVYRSTRGQGANFEYDVVGFAGYHLTGYDLQGSKGLLFGEFTRLIWQGVQSTSGQAEDFGVRAVSLVD